MNLYTDGGLLSSNPSALGGMWAFAVIGADDKIVMEDSGLIMPADVGMPFVTNNVSEMLGALHGLERMPQSWSGKWYTDSWVTLCRIIRPRAAMVGMPGILIDRIRLVQKKFMVGHQPAFNTVLLDGHPKPHHLTLGIGKRGNPVSKWNVHVDMRCNEVRAAYESRQAKPAGG